MGKYGILRDMVFANQLQTLAFETLAWFLRSLPNPQRIFRIDSAGPPADNLTKCFKKFLRIR